MDVSLVRRKEACLLVLGGEIDRSTMDRLAVALTECIESTSSPVLMDFKEITFIDGGGLGLIHDALDQLGEQRWLGVARPNPDLRRTLRLAGLEDRPTFRIFPSMDEALRAAGTGQASE